MRSINSSKISKKSSSSNSNLNLDYNTLYNSDSEFGKKTVDNELSRLMINQKQKLKKKGQKR
jgi:hypothetical protein